MPFVIINWNSYHALASETKETIITYITCLCLYPVSDQDPPTGSSSLYYEAGRYYWQVVTLFVPLSIPITINGPSQ